MLIRIFIIAVIGIIILITIRIETKRHPALGQEVADSAEKIVSYLGCEYEIINNAEDIADIMKRYEGLLVQGRAEGFTPLIIVPGSPLWDAIEGFESSHYNENGRGEAALRIKPVIIDAPGLIQKRIKEAMPSQEEGQYDIMGEFTMKTPADTFASLSNSATGRLNEMLIIAKIPTKNPWELAAWVPMGGWNECPAPEEQAAVFKYWNEKYGAVPAVVHGDIWELYVENPPETEEAARALALEQFGFCSDIVWQGVGTVNALAGGLYKARVWYFWWD